MNPGKLPDNHPDLLLTPEELAAKIDALEVAKARRQALLPIAREIFLHHTKTQSAGPHMQASYRQAHLTELWQYALAVAAIYVDGDAPPESSPP